MYTGGVRRLAWRLALSRIRKQVTISPAQQHKLQRLATRWGCTESEVIRTAIDRLEAEAPAERGDVASPAPRGPLPYEPASEREREILTRLWNDGLLAPPPDDVEPLTDEELEQLEREVDEWFIEHPAPLGLSEAVIEDRR